MFIIVEGIDNVGKSTLIGNLKNHFNDITFHTLHYSNVKQSSKENSIKYSKKLYDEMFGIMLNTLSKTNSGIICDRSHIGEMVYSPMYRDYSGDFVIDIEKRYKNILSLWDDLFLFTIIDTPERAIDRDDGLSFSTDLDKKKLEIDSFLKAHEKSLIKNKYIINIETFNEDEVTKIAIDYINSIKGKKND